jgi:hypothetical protein
MITKELLKKEIDNVQDEYLIPLYKIIKTFEESDEFTDYKTGEIKNENKKMEWKRFIEKFAGCLADTPIERGDQGNFEIRKERERDRQKNFHFSFL